MIISEDVYDAPSARLVRGITILHSICADMARAKTKYCVILCYMRQGVIGLVISFLYRM